MNFLKRHLRIIVFIGVILLLLLSPVRQYLLQINIVEIIKSFAGKPIAPLLYIGFYIVGVIFAFPGLPLTVLSGAMFGFELGTLVTVIGSNLGIQVTFFISRYFGSTLMPFLMRRYPYFKEMDQKLQHNGFRVMVTLRLLPIIPFNAINYLAGLTSVSYKDYTMGNLVGILPATMLYVYFGATAIESQGNPKGLILSIVLLILFTGISTVIKRMQMKKKSEILEKDTDKGD